MPIGFNPFKRNHISDLERTGQSEGWLEPGAGNGSESKPRGVAGRFGRKKVAPNKGYGALHAADPHAAGPHAAGPHAAEEAKAPEFESVAMAALSSRAVQKMGLAKFLLKGLADCDIDQQEALVRREVIRRADMCEHDAAVAETFGQIFHGASACPDNGPPTEVVKYYRRIAAFSRALHSLPERRLSNDCLYRILSLNRSNVSMNGIARGWSNVLNAAIAVGIMEAMPDATPAERKMAISNACGGYRDSSLTPVAGNVLRTEALCERDKLLYLQAMCGGGGKAEDVAQFVVESPLKAGALWKAVVETPCRDDVEPSGVRAGRFKALRCTPEQLLEPVETYQAVTQAEEELQGNLVNLINADIASRAEVHV